MSESYPLPPEPTKRIDCPECQALLVKLQQDIPETNARLAANFNAKDCHGAHTVDAWVENPL